MIGRNKEKLRSSRRTEKAADLVARLYSGEMTHAEELAARQWLADDVRNREEFNAVHALWDHCDDNIHLADLTATEASLHRNTRVIGTRAHYLAAASVVLALGIIAFLIWSPPTTQQLLATYQTRVGEQHEISLSDNTLVQLNTDSRILVDFSDDARKVYLDQGQVFFTVTRDTDRPFTVFAGIKSVTVLGTQFEMHRSHNKLSVSVVEGRVAIHGSDDPYFQAGNERTSRVEIAPGVWQDSRSGAYELESGRVAIFSQGIPSPSIELVDNVDRLLSWQSGTVYFEDIPLIEFVAEINRYLSNKILIEDRDIVDLRVGGILDIHNSEAVLHGLEQAFPIRVIRYPDRVVLVGED